MRSWLKGRIGRSVAVGTIAMGLVGGAAYLVAGPVLGSTVASTTTPSSSAASTLQSATSGSGQSGSAAAGAAATGGGRAGVLRRLLARSDHASLQVKIKGTWQTVTLDRGTIKSISSTSITILRPDGVTVTAPLSSSTKFLRAPESSLGNGDHLVVVQVGSSTRWVVALKKAAGGTGSSAAAGSSSNSTT